MPVVRCVRSIISGARGARLVVGGLGIVRIEFSAVDKRQFGGFAAARVGAHRLRTDGQYVLLLVN
jgi:hypothetical protein